MKLVDAEDPILRAVAAKVEEDDYQTIQGLKLLADDMIDLMFQENGVGLAAPQVGISKQIFVWQSPLTGLNNVAMNPYVMSESNKRNIEVEGCLSLPGEAHEKWRSRSIRVSFYDINIGRRRVGAFDGYEARIVQHELDHLAGRLIDTVV